MLHIAICDDEKDFVQYLTDLLNQYSKETGRNIKITPYYDGMELIEKYDPTIDLIFLDIQMKMVDGLHAAERIRQMNETVGIIFLTTLTQYGLEGYKYHATNYIIKPMKYARLKSEMDKFVERSQKEDIPSLVITNDTGKYKVPLKSIRYVETYNRNLMFHTEQENIICYKSMKEVERELCDKDFVRCHTSYIVNLFYVKGIKKLDIELITGEVIPISQPKRKEFMERLTDYWGGFLMMRFFEILSFLLAWGYTAVFFLILKSFLPLRKNVVLKVIAFLVCGYLADSIIYSNDAGSLFGTMLLFFLYVLLFYRGTFMEKLSVMLVFYPALIAINYLMLDTGGRLFKIITQASYEETLQSPTLMLISTAIYTVSLLLRLLFWIGAWLVLRRFLEKIPSHLNIKTWLIIDMLILASFVAIFTIIYFMPENTAIVYPICGASIFSSFGCMYLAAYIYDSMQTAYRVQQMETQRDYYKERIAEEERVRSIYHDLKNHLLVMESRQNTAETRQMAETLRSQIADYEDYVHTGNEFLDIILKDKAAKAREKQIDFSALVDFKGMDFIEPLDISTIFSNALDNAMEASERLPEDQRLVTVKAERVRDMLIITVENNTLPGTRPAEGTTKKDRFVHGFGIPNIKKAVEKYDGQCSFHQGDGTYLLKILIPIP